MRVVFVNVGPPREVEWDGERVLPRIFKEPVAGRVPRRRLNLARDPGGMSVADANRLMSAAPEDAALLRRAIAVSALPEEWRERFRRRLARIARKS